MDKARYTAVQALVHQEQNGFSNLVLAAMLEKHPLEPRDKAFVSALFYGVTERLLTLDFCLAQCLSKPLAKLDAPVRAVLRSGLYQARYMQVPQAVAVNESVALCRALKKTSAAGFVNAVLRKAIAIDPAKGPFQNQTHRLSVLYSVAQPIVALLLAQYPVQCEAMLAAFFETPQVTLRCNTLKTSEAELQKALDNEGVSTAPGFVSGALAARFKGSPAATRSFEEGLYHVQGQGSQLAALCLGARPGDTVFDLCAAPGGKTLTLAYAMQGKGRLVSCDVAQNRLPLIEKAVQRCGAQNVTILHNDAAQYNPALGEADRVLVDAPCSGLGIIAKKPDIRYKSLQGLEELHALQANILAASARYVKPGGRLVYSTCTIDPRENQQIVHSFLAATPYFKLIPAAFVPQGAVEEEQMLTLLPGFCGSDGFFIATMERT